MKNFNKISLILLMVSFITLAEPVGSQFSYQGQLQENGSPADGLYDMRFGLFSEIVGGGNITAIKGGIELDSIDIDDVSVTNGLFNVVLDFGDAHFMGDDSFLNIQVRNGASTGSYTTLSPRQRINTVPYAIQSEFVENGSSPWTNITGGIGYTDDVKIGNTNTTTQSMLTVDAGAGQSPVRFKINGATRMILGSNGGTTIGANNSAPDNGLRVEGITRLYGNLELREDIKQDVENNGVLKAGLVVTCADGGASSIFRSFNAVNDDAITIGSSTTPGRCTVTFPFSLLDRYYVAMPFNAGAPIRIVNCQQQNIDSPDLICFATDTSGNAIDTNLSILVY